MNPEFLLGKAFKIAYCQRKYHSGTICKGVRNPQAEDAFIECDKEEIPKEDWRRYNKKRRNQQKKSLEKMKGEKGILLFGEFLKGFLEDRKWR